MSLLYGGIGPYTYGGCGSVYVLENGMIPLGKGKCREVAGINEDRDPWNTEN